MKHPKLDWIKCGWARLATNARTANRVGIAVDARWFGIALTGATLVVLSYFALTWLGGQIHASRLAVGLVHAAVVLVIGVGLTAWGKRRSEDNAWGDLPAMNDLEAALPAAPDVNDDGTLFGRLESLDALRYSPEESGTLARDAALNELFLAWDEEQRKMGEAWDKALLSIAKRHERAVRRMGLAKTKPAALRSRRAKRATRTP